MEDDDVRFAVDVPEVRVVAEPEEVRVVVVVDEDVRAVDEDDEVVVDVAGLFVVVSDLLVWRAVSSRSWPALRTVTPEPLAVRVCVTRCSKASLGCWVA